MTAKPQRASCQLWLAVVICLVSGSAQALLLKWQNRQEVCADLQFLWSNQLQGADIADGQPQCPQTGHFSQAFLQTLTIFIGEALCILVFFIWKSMRRSLLNDLLVPPSDYAGISDLEKMRMEELAEEKELMGYDTRGCPLWWWMTPAPIDLVESTLTNFAMIMTYASTVQMLHNFMLVSSAFFSIWLFKKPLKLHEWAGCLVVTIALVVSSIPALRHPEEATDMHQSIHWVGIVLALAGTCLHAFQNVWEEVLFEKGKISSFLAIGIEGLAGTALTLALLPVVDFVGLERPRLGLLQILANRNLLNATLFFTSVSFVQNSSGLIVTKHSSGLVRSLFGALKPPVLWVVEMGLGWNIFHWYYLLGTILLVMGVAIHLFIYPVERLLGPSLTKFFVQPVLCCFGRTADTATINPVEDDTLPVKEEDQWDARSGSTEDRGTPVNILDYSTTPRRRSLPTELELPQIAAPPTERRS